MRLLPWKVEVYDIPIRRAYCLPWWRDFSKGGFKSLLKELPKEITESLWCEQRVNSQKNILVCLYGSLALFGTDMVMCFLLKKSTKCPGMH
jgi:hypothetical protein